MGGRENAEGTALVRGTFDIDFHPIGFDNGAGNAEPQTDALCISGTSVRGSVYAAEN